MKAARAIALAALVLCGCQSGPVRPEGSPAATAAPAQGGGERLVPDAGPTTLVEPPALGPMRSREDEGPPRAGAISPNGGVASRFGRTRQTAAYAFQAQAGELCLFELTCLGFSRGWHSTAVLRVLGPGGRALCEREEEGGASFALFVPFVAPATGHYELELSAPAEPYRFQLVRHAGFPRNVPGERRLVENGRVLGHLGDAQDRARFALVLQAGEAALLSVAPAREGFRDAQEQSRADLVEKALKARRHAAPPDPTRLLRDERVGGEPQSCPLFALEVAGGVAAEVLVPAGAARTLTFDVVALGPSEGGLFELHAARAPALHRVAGRIGDVEDDPLGGMHVRFLREPLLETLTEAETAADGTYEVHLPEGDYSILVAPGPDARIERTRTRVDGASEINLVYGG